jgi:hypothetical protein
MLPAIVPVELKDAATKKNHQEIFERLENRQFFILWREPTDESTW